MSGYIELKDVRTHHLKGFDIQIPLGQCSVVTGLSGSGKSSLVFHTLYAEAYRRYVESLSSYARQFLKALPQPKLSNAHHLPPAVALRQQKSRPGGRSTVGTMTDLVVLLRTLFVQHGQTFCSCSRLVQIDRPDRVAKDLAEKEHDLWVLAPLDEWELSPQELFQWLKQQGFSRCYENGQRVKLDYYQDGGVPKTACVLITKVKPSQLFKVEEALSLAFRVGKRKCVVLCGEETFHYSSDMTCNHCQKSYRVPSVGLLSWNHPLGACGSCQGFGRVPVLNWEKIFPDEDLSVEEGGVQPLSFSNHHKWLRKYKGPLATPLRLLSEKNKDDLRAFVKDYFSWVDTKKYKSHYRIHSARYHEYHKCDDCLGVRLNEQSRAVQYRGKNLGDVCRMSIAELCEWVEIFPAQGVEDAHQETMEMLRYLQNIGLGYLNLERKTETLSGGELQRLKMARSLGHELTETLYCLDEPTAGLHPLDVQAVVQMMRALCDQGNTVVVVEHDAHVIEQADHVFCLGPEAGHRGGDLVPGWDPVSFEECLSERRHEQPLLFVSGEQHNLKSQKIILQANALNLICGVSGSGKSTLIRHVLAPEVQKHINGVHSQVLEGKGWDCFAQLLVVDQEPPGKSKRSNIATYLGVMDEMRKLFAAEPLAQQLGLKAGAFSFNVPGGRCETCVGLGEVEEDVSFLGVVRQVCPECDGRRFDEKVLSVRCRYKNLAQILEMTVDEALSHFHDSKKISKILRNVVAAGLGYLTLGQTTSSFSGGEAQRLKLLHELVQVRHDKPHLIVLDEPTVGLSDQDVVRLLKNLEIVLSAGHTVIVVEHHMGLLRSADWVVEMGPGAGPEGGTAIYQGRVEELKSFESSKTAPFLS